MKKTIFVVDDSDLYLSDVRNALRASYNVLTISSGKKMFGLLEKVMPHLILLDIEMPEMGGIEVLTVLKTEPKYKDIPVIFLTSMHDTDVEASGFDMGAVDFIQKPFAASVLMNRVRLHLDMGELIREQTEEIRKTKENTILVLANAVENRDHCTGGHIERTTQYVALLVREMLSRGVYEEELSGWDLAKVAVSALLHDVGKLGIPDHILNKPGKLTAEEYENIKTHALAGEKIINDIIELTQGEDIFLHSAKMFAAYHHERWDGTGYPYGLVGEKIPLQGRILAIVDVYDALVSERPYKKAFSHEKAVEIIIESKGTQFDPHIVEVFVEIHDKLAQCSPCVGRVPEQ